MKKMPRHFECFRSWKRKILLVTVLTILATAGSFVETLLMSNVVDKLSSGSSNTVSLLWLATIILAVEVAGYTATRKADREILKIKSSVSKKIYYDLAKALANSTVESVTQNETSEITKRVREGSTFVGSIHAIYQEMFSLAIGIAAIIYTACCAWQVAIFIAAFMVVILITQNRFRLKLNKANMTARSALEKSEQTLFEIVMGFMDAKVQKLVAGLKPHLLDAYSDEVEREVAVEDLAKENSFLSKILMAIYKFGFLALSLILLSKGTIRFEQFVALFMYKGYTYGAVFNIIKITKYVSVCQTSMQRMDDILQEGKVKQEQFGSQRINNPEGKLEAVNLWVERDNKPILKGINLSLGPKGFYGIVGPKGSGKSTFLSAVAGLLKAEAGQIIIDGVESFSLTESCFRRLIRLVPQKPKLFTGLTIGENLKLGNPEATNEQIWNALTKWHADQTVREKGGLDAVVRSNNFSGGERQLLILARTELAGGKIILMDECTSALDSETQAAVVETIQKEAEEKTIVMVAHRVPTLKNADGIFFLKDGNIAASGTYWELYNSYPEFRAMVENG